MCKYCDYDLPLHYLLNDAPLLTKDLATAADLEIESLEVQAIFPDLESDNPSYINTIPAEYDVDATVFSEIQEVEVSAVEEVVSSFEIPDAVLNRELKGDRQYRGMLASGEALPDWIAIDAETGKLTFEAEYEEIGSHEILIQVEDEFGQVASLIVDLVVASQTGAETLLVDDDNGEPEIIVSEGDFGTVQEAAAIPQITIADTQVTDSSVGRELIFTVTLDAASDRTVTVNYASADDTAKEDEDYIAVNGKLTFAPGETEQNITVNTTGTSYLDPDKDLSINLSNPKNAEIEDDRGIGTILPAYAGIRGGSRKQETVTFSFFDEDIFGQGGYDGSDRESNAKEPSEVIKANYRQIFKDLNTFVDREFIEVEESEAKQGDIRIVISDGPDFAYAGGHIHLAGWAAASDAGGNGWESPQGVYAYSALMHELGHAIGMPHSFGRETSVFDPEESGVNTVMSYTSPGAKAATFMSYDIKSLQARYGAAAYREGDTVYEFVTVDNYLVDGEIAIDTNRRLKQTIWDSGGTDTFDFSSLATEDSGYRFDLNQSQYQTTQPGYEGASYERNGTIYKVPDYGTSIAIDTEIENLVNSSSDDLIIANPAANIFSGYAPGLTTGDDIFLGTDELDTLDLSEFSFLDISQIVTETDLKIGLGQGNSITVPDYLATAQAERINVLLDNRSVFFPEEISNGVEGDNGVKLINFPVRLSQASNERIEIDYTTADRTAKQGSDYVAKTGTVVFEPGETSKNIAVEIIGDTEIEGSEEFEVHLLGNYGQIISQGYGLIDDNDGLESLSTITISDAIVTSGRDGTKAVFEVRVDEFIGSDPVTVDFTTQDNVAVAGQDYIANSGTLAFSIQDRDKVKTIEVDLIDDNILSRDEDFTLQLSNPSENATIADSEGIGTILDSTLKISLPDNTETELQLASYPADGKKDPNNLPFEVDAEHNTLTIAGDGNGWKEVPLADNLSSNDSLLKPNTVVEFDFKTTETGKLHGLHFESKDHHSFYAPWEEGRFFQLAGSSEFGIQDFNNYEDSLGEWKTYQIPVGQFIDNKVFHDGNSKAVQWLAFAHEGNSEESNSQFRNLEFKELLPISIEDVIVSESSDTATFTLTIPEASEEVISLDYATADDTAIAGEDYIAKTGTVTFASGETSKIIAVDLNDDGESEGIESFSLNLSNVANAISLESEVTVTIEDNDEPLPVISVEDISFAEGNAENNVSVAIALSKPSTKPITVKYSTEDDTALSDEDYQEAAGTVTFAPGETNKAISLTIQGDVLNETDESLFLNLSDANNADLESDGAVITIANDDALPQISVKDAGVLSSIPVRNDDDKIKNSTGLLFEVTLDSPSNQTVKVNYATEDGTAIAGEDYSAKDKTLTFKPGETVKNVFVGVTLDETEETDEQLNLILDNSENAVIADDRAVGTIEETRSLNISDLKISEDGKEAVFTVSLDKPSVQGVFVNYATENGTAKAGADYTETKGRLFIKAGEASGTISVPLIDNQLTETDETFYLNLSKPKYVLLEEESDRAVAKIIDNDPIPTFNPGGIYQNLQLWVKANAAVANDEQKVAKWLDNSQQELNLAQTNSDEQPSLNTDGLNHNPVLSFDGDDLLETIDTLPADFADNSSVFVVTKADSNRNNFLFTLDNTGYGRFLAHLPWSNQIYFDAGNTSTGRLSIPYTDSNADRFNTWHFRSDLDDGQNIFRNGLSVASDDDATSPKTSDRHFQIGRQFEGDIAEVIVFNQALNESDRLAVDSYLATKYGFTLDRTTSSDYLNSQGKTVWEASKAGEYSHDVAGITIDSGSGLSQLKSRSSNDDGIVTLSNSGDLQNGEALFWSNNNASLDPGAVKLTDEQYHLNRQWQVQTTGSVGKVDLSFDLTGLGYEIQNSEQYALLIDDDGDFSNATTYQAGLKVRGNEISFSNVDLQDSEYFTLAVPEKQAPSGIKSALQLWLQGDEAIIEAGEVVQWRDRSGKERNYTPNATANQPKLGDQINFNPAVSFDGNDLLTTDRQNFTQGEVFFVLKGQDSNASSSLIGDRNGYNTSNFKFEQWYNKGNIGFSRRGVRDYTSDLPTPIDELSLISFNTEEDSSIVNLAIENDGKLAQASLDIEVSNPISIEYLAQEFTGEIAEVIIFDSVLDNSERQKLRSNLAVKYGLTLERNTDLIDSDNLVWWDADAAEEYSYNVAAIAQDDSADLLQTKSRSSNIDSVITITAEDTVNGLEDGEALVWGNNNQNELKGLVWQVQEQQGDVGNVAVSFDLSKLEDKVSLENYALQIDRNDNFNDSQLITTGKKIEGNILTFSNINFQDGEYFTLNTEYIEPPVAEEENPVTQPPLVETEDPVTQPPVVEEEDPVTQTPVTETEDPITQPPVTETEDPVIQPPVTETEDPVTQPPVVQEEEPVTQPPVVQEEEPVTQPPVIETEDPVTQPSVTETEDPVTQPPVTETEDPVIQPPVTETEDPVIQPPVTETEDPATQPPVTETEDPVIQPPVTETEDPVIQPPVVEAEDPVTQPPVVVEAENPVIQPPVVEAEDPVTQPPVVEEEDPVTQPPVTETEDPVTQPPVVEEEDPVTQPPVTETEDPVTQPPVIETFDISRLELTEVHRFFDPQAGYHVYSMNENDRQKLNNDNQIKYNYEGESFAVLDNLDDLTGAMATEAQPVYGFFNKDTDAQLFTMDINEKDYILDNLDNYQDLGITYYAFATKPNAIATISVYRLLNEDTGTHLLTSDRNELNYIQNNFDNFNLENNSEPVFYALEI